MQMQKAIIGKKVGMTQIFDESGKVIPVTVIEAGPCVVTQKKTTEKDGYNAVQLGFEDVKESKLTKPELGHLKKAEVALKKHLKEFRVEKAAEMNVGDEIKASVFAVGDKVDVTGISKGHGYEGPVKRCGGHRTPMTHGGGPVHRQAGSMGGTYKDVIDIMIEYGVVNACNMDGGSSSIMVYRDTYGLFGEAGTVQVINSYSLLQERPRKMPTFWMVAP